MWRIIGFFAVLYMLYLAFNFTFVHIHVERHDKITGSVSLYSSSQNQKESSIFIIGEIGLVRRDTVALRAVSGSYQTSKSIPPLPLIGFTSVTINLYKDRAVQKYSGESLGCAAYDKAADKVVSFNCFTPVNLVHYNRPTDGAIWENKLLATMTEGFPPIYSIKPFMNGVIGIQQHPESDQDYRNLVFTYDSNGTRKSYDLPPEVDRNNIGSLSLKVDSASSDSGKFMIINSATGELHVGTLSSGTVTYNTTKVADDYDSRDAFICTLLTSTVYCYLGLSSHESDNPFESTDHSKDITNSTIKVFDFSKSNPSVSVYNFSNEIGVNGIHVTRAKNIYITSENKDTFLDDIYGIRLENEKATPQLMLTDISSTDFGNGLLYVQNNAIYKIDDEKDESYKVFSSKNLRISNINTIGDDVFFNAFVEKMTDQKLHTYKLLNHASQQPAGKRLVDLLPFYMGSSLIDIDYMDSTIRVRVFATAIPDRATGRLLVDGGEYENNRVAIENQLNSLGITSENYKIIYSK